MRYLLFTVFLALTSLHAAEYHIERHEFEFEDVQLVKEITDVPADLPFVALARNDSGNLAGYRVVGSWDKIVPMVRVDGQDYTIDLLDEGVAFDINNSNQVVGIVADEESDAEGMFLWTPESKAHFISGSLEDSTSYMYPFITDQGTIFGTLDRGPGPDEDPNDYQQIAFVWDEASGVQELITLIPENSGWEALTSVFRNAKTGSIVGFGIYHGEEAQFILKKVDA